MLYSALKCTALAATLSLAIHAAGARAETGAAGKSIHVASIPTGADVYVMGSHVGATPMVINERDIYPISYKPGDESQYGSVSFRKAGCGDYSKRMTRADINDGLTAVLACKPAAAAQEKLPRPDVTTAATDVQRATVAATGEPEAAPSPASMSEQRLQQLRVLQQLLNEGLISDAEEKVIRKRILDAP